MTRILSPNDEDLRHTLEVFARLCREPALRSQQLIAEASGSRVTIHGFVSRPELRNLAWEVVRGLPWVATVEAYITLAEEEMDPPPRASLPRPPGDSSARFSASRNRPARRDRREHSGKGRMKGVGG